MLENSSERSQMFLRAWKGRLENDPASIRKLLYADSQIKASGITPDSPEYFEALESRMHLPAAERAREFESRQGATKRKQSDKTKLSPEQIEAARITGVDPDEYAKHASDTYTFDPKADDSQAYVDPNGSVDTGKNAAAGEENGAEIHFEKPKVKEVQLPSNYRQSKSTITLNPTEVELCKNMALSTNRPEKDVIKEFAIEKARLHAGESSYKLADEKQRASTPAKHW